MQQPGREIRKKKRKKDWVEKKNQCRNWVRQLSLIRCVWHWTAKRKGWLLRYTYKSRSEVPLTQTYTCMCREKNTNETYKEWCYWTFATHLLYSSSSSSSSLHFYHLRTKRYITLMVILYTFSFSSSSSYFFFFHSRFAFTTHLYLRFFLLFFLQPPHFLFV